MLEFFILLFSFFLYGMTDLKREGEAILKKNGKN